MQLTQRISYLCREENERPLDLIHKMSNIGGSPKPEMVSEQCNKSAKASAKK